MTAMWQNVDDLTPVAATEATCHRCTSIGDLMDPNPFPTQAEARARYKEAILPDVMARVAAHIAQELASQPGPLYEVRMPLDFGSYELIRSALDALYRPLKEKGWRVSTSSGNIDQTTPMVVHFATMRPSE